jgi:hypothetical protein
MTFQILTCPSCAVTVTFYTTNELAEHHLDAHQRLTRRDGTLLVPMSLETAVIGTTPTRPRWIDVRTLALVLHRNGTRHEGERA